MQLRVSKSSARGRVRIPGSKSHTIRALFLASLAEGESEIINPLISDDAISAVSVCSSFGAEIVPADNKYLVKGFKGMPKVPDDIVNVGNSGTTLRFAVMTAGLNEGCTVFTGDHQIRRRPLEPLIKAINNLGAKAFSTRNNGMAPVVIKGRIKGGITDLDCVSSQYLSSMLIHCPLLEKDTEIEVTRLNEVPYAEMTLWWLEKQGIRYLNNSFKDIYIPGNQCYKPFKMSIPGDFSSATFLAVLAAISGEEFVLENLDITDPQGDKDIFGILEGMGTKVSYGKDCITIKGNRLKGMEIDMNAIPDALPAMAVAACFAEGETRLVNVPQARMKETDRIKVMFEELSKMGADIKELPDGLIIRESKLKGCRVNGHDDHRIVMALAVAGLNIEGETIIDTAEAINVTFPDFVKLLEQCGGDLALID